MTQLSPDVLPKYLLLGVLAGLVGRAVQWDIAENNAIV